MATVQLEPSARLRALGAHVLEPLQICEDFLTGNLEAASFSFSSRRADFWRPKIAGGPTLWLANGGDEFVILDAKPLWTCPGKPGQQAARLG